MKPPNLLFSGLGSFKEPEKPEKCPAKNLEVADVAVLLHHLAAQHFESQGQP